MDKDNFNISESSSGHKKGPLSNMPPLIFIFLSLTIVFILYQIVGGLITFLVTGEDLKINEENLNLTRIILTFAQFMFILFPAIFLVMLQDNDLKETFRLKKPKILIFVLAITGILVIQPFLQVYLYYQNELIFSLPFGQEIINSMKQLFDLLESTTEKLVTARTVPEFLLIVMVIAVTPAICEEFLFRGLVLKNFEKITIASKAIFFSGLLFAFFHFHPFNILPLAILGFFLAYVVYHSGSIYTSVACHFINNFISALAVFIYGKDVMGTENAADMTSQEQIQFIILGIISLAVFIGIIILIKKYSVTKDQLNKLHQTTNE
ncbi:MAG: CPBP family intramembrane metalloprotease [Bacteroidota bacterium]|nr:CPBP family intramembrane metalloprotease [Bacteroidota bacterium]